MVFRSFGITKESEKRKITPFEINRYKVFCTITLLNAFCYFSTMDIYNNKNAVKIIFIFIATVIGLGTILYTDTFLKELRAEEVRRAKLFVEAMDIAQNATDDVNLSFVLKIIEGNSTIPIIVVNENGEVTAYRNLDPVKSKDADWIKKQVPLMAAENEPIEVTFAANRKNIIYYQESTLLTQLRLYPIMLLLVISVFIGIAYLAFSSSRRSEQNRVWTGMAKETAHQIGTPLSSLMGWIEILRSQNTDEMALVEMEKDVSRLVTITDRFSKIGSMPTMKDENIAEVTEHAFNYLATRASKKIKMTLNNNLGKTVIIRVNQQLLGWVIENLVRNAIDAIAGPGEVKIELSEHGKWIKLDVTDTGKGIAKAQHSIVFRPGFSTKTRGWGLGLSLAKRIVEEYHKGKIFVVQSELGKGTNFRILLPKSN